MIIWLDVGKKRQNLAKNTSVPQPQPVSPKLNESKKDLTKVIEEMETDSDDSSGSDDDNSDSENECKTIEKNTSNDIQMTDNNSHNQNIRYNNYSRPPQSYQYHPQQTQQFPPQLAQQMMPTQYPPQFQQAIQHYQPYRQPPQYQTNVYGPARGPPTQSTHFHPYNQSTNTAQQPTHNTKQSQQTQKQTRTQPTMETFKKIGKAIVKSLHDYERLDYNEIKKISDINMSTNAIDNYSYVLKYNWINNIKLYKSSHKKKKLGTTFKSITNMSLYDEVYKLKKRKSIEKRFKKKLQKLKLSKWKPTLKDVGLE